MKERTGNSVDQERILILAPVGRDAELISGLLRRSDLATFVCRDVGQLCRELRVGAGMAIIAEEALTRAESDCLIEELSNQPTWSELPLVVLTAPGRTSRRTQPPAEALEEIANITHLDRPVRTLTLVSTVQAALRARRRQYQVRELLEIKERALRDFEVGLRQRDEFLAMLGHELRNPLAAISGSLHLLEELRWDRAVVDGQRSVLERQTKNLTKLVDDLLDVSRITNGRIALQKVPLNLGDLVRHAAAAVHERYKKAGIGLDLVIDSTPIIVEGDELRLEQVLNNLLTNAVKFTPSGGTVRISLSKDGPSAIISVRDNGLGIPRDMVDRVFDLFTQAHASVDRRLGGLGIGLTIVRRLVELHGGTILARSEGMNLGAEFVIRLPKMEAASAAEPRKPIRKGPRRRVLLVEDNEDSRTTMGRLLALWGHDVEIADNGEAGLEKALELQPDAVLLDIGLPGLDGYEIARQLRSKGYGKRLIAMTGYGQPEDQQRALEAGFNSHLVKPIDLAQLSQMIVDSAPD